MLLLSTATLYKYGLNRIFHFAKELDLGGIEICVNDIVDTRDVPYLKELIKRYDLPVLVVSLYKDINIEKIKKVVEIAKEIKAEVCSIRPGPWKNWILNKWIENNFNKISTTMNIKLSLINPPLGDSVFFPSYAFGDIESLLKFKYITLDPVHLLSRGIDLIRAYDFLKRNICHTYLSDANKNSTHIIPGDGILPLESYLSKLKKDNYNGHISIKVRWEVMEGNDVSKMLDKLQKIHEFYIKYYVNID